MAHSRLIESMGIIGDSGTISVCVCILVMEAYDEIQLDVITKHFIKTLLFLSEIPMRFPKTQEHQ